MKNLTKYILNITFHLFLLVLTISVTAFTVANETQKSDPPLIEEEYLEHEALKGNQARDNSHDNYAFLSIVEEMPRFPGGEEARLAFLRENMTYPREAVRAGIEGTVFVSFTVEKDGSITNVVILRGIGGGCDEEAIRVTRIMPNWAPGKQRGKPVRTQFRMPIRFRCSCDPVYITF